MEITSLSENLLFTTVKIDTVNNSGVGGSGTGFLFTHKYKEKTYPFIVTNKHVVQEANQGELTFIQQDGENPKLGDSYKIYFDDFEKNWIGHPDKNIDITVMPLAPITDLITKQGVKIFYKTVGTDHIPNEEQKKEIDAFEEVIFIGYPNGIWDSKNFLPIMRKGTTATPFIVDYEGEKKFLIDASVFGGSSGSPVFIYQSGAYTTKNGPIKAGTKFYFVGVIAAVYFKTDAHDIVSLPIPTNMKNYAIDKEMIDLGIVFKAETVISAIENAIEKLTK